MAQSELVDAPFEEDDHRVAFIFQANPPSSHEKGADGATARSAKRRKLAGSSSSTLKKHQQHGSEAANASVGVGVGFPPLFGGAESPEAASLRRELFDEAWPVLEKRVQQVLRDANRNTLDEVAGFLKSAAGIDADKLTSAFIITGPNIAAQDLLFEQLADRLCAGDADADLPGGDGADHAAPPRFVRLRASDAPNLKAVLRKIIRDASAAGPGGDEEDAGAVVVQGGRKYLDYDLEALHVFLRQHQTRRVVVAFQDGEAFDSVLLTDLISLLHSWRDRIRFELLFGIATSVELFQARLAKSTARQLYGAQFDVVQAGSVLDGVVKTAVASTHAALRIGPSLLRTLVDRQRHHVAGVHAFVASLKYAYMCHFYADPLSLLLLGGGRLTRALLQPEHLEAARTLGSFQAEVEAAVEARQLRHARSLIEDDEYLANQILDHGARRREYLLRLLRSLHLIAASGLAPLSFTELYMLALSDGLDVSQAEPATLPLQDAIRRLGPDDFLALASRLLGAISAGSPELGLAGFAADADDLVASLTDLRDEVDGLAARARARGQGAALKSRYSAQSRVLRTTVVAHKVQLSRDDATLTDEDRAFTAAVDRLCDVLARHLRCEPLADLFLHEPWTFDARAPCRDVFAPRPGTTFGRALARPHDYLACACCAAAAAPAAGPAGRLDPALPTAAALYHLYLEAGALINVADLWSAYYALVGGGGDGGGEGDGEGEEESDADDGAESGAGLDERTALVQFYRGLAELRMMGFVRPSRRKADHIAKVKWL
ncbi:hypothetical protein VTJ83DRAFT_1989 [Remersonia thermophila]|uniref:Origin recognition complex subunit n=1 Tax=Remersonia thermophila TaxID=72144 RepID=A0ABR4DI25_9PEZI